MFNIGILNKSVSYWLKLIRSTVGSIQGKDNIKQGEIKKLKKACEELEKKVNKKTFELEQRDSERTAELIKTNEKLNKSQEIAHLGSWELNVENNSLSWSDEVYRIFGLQPQEFEATYDAFLQLIHPDDKEKVNNAYSGSIKEGRDSYEIEHRIIQHHTGNIRYVHEKCEHIKDNRGKIIRSMGMVLDITERKKNEEALISSEERVRLKLQSILSPDGDIGNLSLEDILDKDEIQGLMENFYNLVKIPMAIIDTDGKVMVGIGWQEICTCFHRVHPATSKNCIQSDTKLTEHIPNGEFKLYKCKNGMWDIATPLFVGGRHVGNLFMGQFFLDDEPVNYNFFRAQAEKYKFDEKIYINALNKVRRLSHSELNYAKGFFLRLSHSLTQLSYSNIKLARNISEREKLTLSLQRNNERLEILSQAAALLLTSENPLEIVNEICNRIIKFIPCDVFFMYLVDEATQKMQLHTSSGITKVILKSIRCSDYESALYDYIDKNKTSGSIPELQNFQTKFIQYLGINGYACHPLLLKGKVIGTLSFGSRDEFKFSNEDMAFIKAITDQVAIAMNRVRYESALRDSENRFRTIAESLPVLVSISRPADGVFLYLNNAFEKVFGFKNGELLGKKMPELFSNPYEPEKITKIITENGLLQKYEVKVKKTDGTPFWLMAHVQPIVFAGESAFLGSAIDITDRKIGELELSQLNRTLNALSKSSQAMMHVVDELQYLNQICKIVIEDCGHAMIWIGYANNDEEKSVTPVAYSGYEEGYIDQLNISWADNERGLGPTGTSIRTGKIVICSNMQTDPKFKLWRKEALKRGYGSSIVLPLISNGKTFGAISIYSREIDPFSEKEVNLLQSLSNDLAYGITYIRLRESEKKIAESIMESEEKYRLLFNGMSEGFAMHEIITGENGKPRDYRFLNINPAYEKHTGLKAENIIGRTLYEILPDSEKIWVETYGKVALTGKSVGFEKYDAALNKYFRINAFCPKKGFFAVVVENITKRMVAEKELQNTKNYLENLISNANAPIIVWNAENKTQLFNRAFENLTGYSSEEVRGRKISFLFPKSELKDSIAKIRTAMMENLETIELPIYTKNKDIRTVLWNSAKIFDDNGNILSTIVQGNDITERIKAELEIRKSKEKLNLTLEKGNIGIWEWDLKSDTLYWDESMERMLGAEPGFFENTYEAFEKHIYDEDLAHFRNGIRKAIEEDIPLDTIYRAHLKNDSINYLSTKAFVEKDNYGSPIRMTGICFDITEMKKGTEKTLFKLNEDLLRSNKELEQFAYIASHDLQEPLRMISSFTQLLSLKYKNELDENAQDYIQFAVDGATRMQNLINDLLEYSRVETRGKMFSTIDMHGIFEQVLRNLRILIKEKNALVITDDLPKILADERQMIQLLQNLIANALKFSKNNPRIYITANEDLKHFIFEIKDNGIGIEPQYYEKIFQIFQRLQPREEYGGTGIGLAICKRIVERHGGKIWVESKPGKGSVFYFTILKR